MGLLGKLTLQVEVTTRADVFFELYRHTPHHVSSMSPSIVHSCDHHDGELGAVGSVIFWKYTHDGIEQSAKEIVESIDEENKSIRFKVIEGDVLQWYKSFALELRVDSINGRNFVSWALEYEKMDEDVEDPVSIISFFIKCTKDIEAHHLKTT